MAGVGSRRQIKVISENTQEDANGYPKPDPVVLFAGWAEIRQASGFREFMQGQAQLGNTKEFKIRNNRQIEVDVKTRVIYDGKLYAVSSILPEREKKFYWIIRATAIDGGRN